MASFKEVQTRSIIEKCLKENMAIYLPLVDLSQGKIFFSRVSDFNKELEKGPFGIFQPKFDKRNLLKDTKDIDLIVVPGMAFDEKGGRIGNGKGFYDKFLATVPPHITIIALAFELQIVDEIILFNHDIPVHKIITEKRIISCAK
jgi:5-formyltetrahydrofolate cyclo-ligase